MSDFSFRLCRRTFAVCLKDTAAPGGKTESEAVGRVQGISLPGGEMEDDAASGDRRGEPCGGAVPASGLHRDSVAYLAGLP